MSRWLPWLLLMCVPCVLFPGALPGPDVVSADDHLTVHHAFQEQAGGRVRHPQLSDPALQFAALRQRVVTALRAGEAPLWNPDIWTGAPLLGDGQSMVGSPVTWAHVVFDSDTAQDVGVVWVLLWTGIGTALLAGRLGMGPWGACTAGTAAMTGPFTQVWLLHPHAATFAWLPWVLLGLERRHGVLTAVAVAGLLAGGHPQTAAHALAIAGGWALLRQRWRVACVAVPVGALLAAPVWLPFAEEVLRSASAAAHGGNRLAPGQLLDLVWPGWHGHPAAETWTSRATAWADGRLHPGLGVLALVGLAAIRGRSPARGLVGAWALCVAVAVVGFFGPINHARLGSIGAWFLALGAGSGVYFLPRRVRAVALVAVLATGAWAARWDQATLPAEAHAPAPAAWTQRLRAEVGCAPGGMSAEGCGRVIGLGWALQPNTGALAGIPDVRGYDLPVSVDTERLMASLRSPPMRPWFSIDRPPSKALLRWLGVRAVVSTERLPDLVPIDIGRAPVFAHRAPVAAPRAWVATAPVAVAVPEDATRRLATSAASRPPVERLPGEWPSTGRTHPATWLVDQPGELILRTDVDVPGVLVVTDAWHPGWQAFVDGLPVPCLRVGGVFRGVVVAAGAHTVRLRFNPWGWQLGRWLGLFGVFVLGFVGLRSRAISG